MNRCGAVERELEDAELDQLSAAARAHVDSCAHCGELVMALGRVDDALEKLPVRPAPEFADADVDAAEPGELRAVGNLLRYGIPRARRRRPLWPVACAGAIAGLAALVFWSAGIGESGPSRARAPMSESRALSTGGRTATASAQTTAAVFDALRDSMHSFPECFAGVEGGPGRYIFDVEVQLLRGRIVTVRLHGLAGQQARCVLQRVRALSFAPETTGTVRAPAAVLVP